MSLDWEIGTLADIVDDGELWVASDVGDDSEMRRKLGKKGLRANPHRQFHPSR